MRTINILTALILLFSHSAAFSTFKAEITFPDEGCYYHWLTFEDINGKLTSTAPLHTHDESVEIELPLVKDEVPQCVLYILDKDTGNLAVLEIEAQPEEPVEFELKTSDFDHVRKVDVIAVSSDRKRVAAAIVELEDSGGEIQTRILDPSANGLAQFENVPEGSAKITVRYDKARSASHDIEISLKRDDVVPLIEVPVVGKVQTLEAVEERVETSGRTADRVSPGDINFPMAMVGLILFVGIIYLAAITMRNRGAGFRQLMKKVGVNLPEDAENVQSAAGAPAQPQVDPSICQFCGGKKDPATGNCACSVGAAPASTGVADTGSGPRLVAAQGAHMGSVFAFEGDTITIGREETNVISLNQDNAVSRKHARITKTDGGFTIYDEGSSNGTFVNGVKISEQALNPGDEITIGGTRLRFEA